MYNNIEEFKGAICDHTISAERMFGRTWFMNYDNRKGGYLWQEDEYGNRIYERKAELGELWNLFNYYRKSGYYYVTDENGEII